MEKLNILRDDPAFLDNSNTDDDVFNHKSVANVIFKVIQDNIAPLTLGLFGGWGIGKSSIINILKNKCSIEKDKYPFVYFNAWAFSDDSFRRQFLLGLAKDLIEDESKKAEEIDRLQKLNYAKSLEEEDGITVKGIWDWLRSRNDDATPDIKKIFTSASSNVKFNDVGIISIIFSFFFLLVALAIFIWGIYDNDKEKQHLGFLAFILSAASFFAPKVENILVLKRREVFDAKLIFPEQFEKEYEELLKKYSNEKQKVIIVIDDLDRCDAESIKNVLVSLKNYLSNQRCIFIVPIDDSSVVRMFQNNNTNFGYEQLRKYFNVSIRIPSIHTEDLLDFANKVAKEYSIPPDVIFIAASGYCTDARKMKHFLNLFKLKYALAEEREAGGYLSYIKTTSIQQQIAKIVVLEYQFPEFYRFISNNPDELENITNSARGIPKEIEEVKLTEIHKGITTVELLWSEFNGLKEFLSRTYDIPINNFDILSKLKITNQETSLSDLGINLRNAIINNSTIEIDKIITEDIYKEKGEDIVETLKKYYDENLIIAKRAIDISIELLKKNKFEIQTSKKLFKNVVSIISIPRINFKVDNNSIEIFLNNFTCLSFKQMTELTNKINLDIFIKAKYFPNFELILNNSSFKELLKLNSAVNKNISTVIEEWYFLSPSLIEKQNFLMKVINFNLDKDERIKLNFIFPSNNFLNKITDLLIVDLNDESNVLNSQILDILANENNPEEFNIIRNKVFDKISQIIETNITIETNATEDSLNHLLEESLTFINDAPSYPDDTNALRIEQLLISNYPNFSKSQEKYKILTPLLFCYESLSSNTSNQIETDSMKIKYLNMVTELNYIQLKNHLCLIEDKFVEDNTVKKKLLPEIIKTTWEFINNDIADENIQLKQKFELCFDYKIYISKEDQFNFVKKIISNKNADVIKYWEESILKLVEHFDDDNKIQLLDLIEENLINSEITLEVRNLFGDLLTSFLKLVTVQQGKEYFKKLYLKFSSDDKVIIDYLNNKWDWFIDRYGNEIPKNNINEIIDNIIVKNDNSINHIAINRSLDLMVNLKDETINKLSEKLIVDLPNPNLNFQHRSNLIALGFYTRKSFEKRNELSKVLFEYKENGDNDELKTESWKVYKHLVDKKIIKEYKEK